MKKAFAQLKGSKCKMKGHDSSCQDVSQSSEPDRTAT